MWNIPGRAAGNITPGDENATSATKLYVIVASCGHSGRTGKKKQKREKKSYCGVTEGSGVVTWS